MKELPLIELPHRDAWRQWLHENHATAEGVALKFAKKGAPRQTVTQSEAIDEALCFGWIDGQIGRLDEHYYKTRFTPRRPRSRWSLINTRKAEMLIEQGLMQPAGLREVERAQADGRWDAAYNQGTDAPPEDFAAALAANPAAQAFYDSLSGQNKFAFSFRLGGIKRPETRARRIEEYVQMLAERRAFH